jgi:hypothetical protein
MKQSVLRNMSPKKKNEKRCLKFTWRIRLYFKIEYRNAVLSRGTLIHRCWRGSCAQENLKKTMRIKPTTINNLLVKFPVIPRLSGSLSGMSGPSVPQYPDKHPEFPGNCSPSEVSLRPESPDPSVRSIRTYTRSIRVSFIQRLVFYERGYKYPPYPFIQLSFAHFNQKILASKRRALSLPLFHSWVIFFGDSSEIVARAKICVSKLPFHLLSTTPLSSRWIQVYYSWSFKLLDG